jgi:hypothetical protein
MCLLYRAGIQQAIEGEASKKTFYLADLWLLPLSQCNYAPVASNSPHFQIKLLELIDHISFVFQKRISFEVYSNVKEQTATNNK